MTLDQQRVLLVFGRYTASEFAAVFGEAAGNFLRDEWVWEMLALLSQKLQLERHIRGPWLPRTKSEVKRWLKQLSNLDRSRKKDLQNYALACKALKSFEKRFGAGVNRIIKFALDKPFVSDTQTSTDLNSTRSFSEKSTWRFYFLTRALISGLSWCARTSSCAICAN